MAEKTGLTWMTDIATEFGITDADYKSISTVGYATRVMADYMDQIDYRSIEDKKEKFLTTATKMSSLYKHARKEGIEPDKASSSTLPIYLFVYLDDIAATSVIDSSTNKKKLVITNDTIFKVGVHSFRLDYPINVFSYGNADTKYFATYDTSTKNPVSDITATTIAVRKYVKDNKDCLLLNINIRDYSIQTAELGYIGPSSSATFNVSYTNYIQYIECKYRDPLETTYRTINTAMFFDKSVESETIFYVIQDAYIAFANKYKSGRFDPIAGGRFKFNIYTTTCVTFDEYTGDTSIVLNDDAEYSLDFSITGGATGGATPMDKDTLRTYIKRYNSTNNALISTTDVDTYLESYGNTDTVYASYKYIDSFNDRIYNVVMRLGSATNMLPTNTTDLKINEAYCKLYTNGRFMTFDNDQEFVAVKDSLDNNFIVSKYQFLNDPEYTSYDKTNYISFALPYQFCYDRKYNLITVFEKSVNRTVSLLYTYTEESAYTYICSGLQYKYLLDYDDINEYYELNYVLTPSIDDMISLIHKTTTSTNSVSILNDLGYLKAVVVFHADGVPIGYMPSSISSFNETEGTYNMTTPIRMNSPIYFDSLDVSIYDINTHLVIDTTLSLNKVVPTIVLYKEVSGYLDVTGQTKYPKFSDYSIVNVFDVIDNGTSDTMIFKEMSKYFPTQINDKTVDLNNVTASNPFGVIKEVVLDKLPVVEYNYYENNQEIVQAALSSELSILAVMNKKLEGLFKLRMNLVNTYGYSNRLMVGLDPVSIGKTHVEMVVNVRRTSGSILTDSEIAIFINAYFSEVNFHKGETFHFSKLVESIKSTYSDIEFMELKSVNGITNDNQYIYMKDYDNVLFIPEVANIAKDADGNFKITIITV